MTCKQSMCEKATMLAILWQSLKAHTEEELPTYQRLRDWIDGQTFRELDFQVLDILTGMVFPSCGGTTKR